VKSYPPCPYYIYIYIYSRESVGRDQILNVGNVEIICRSQQHKEKTNHVAEQHEEEQLFVTTCFATSNRSCDSWLIDSGCTNHMTNNQKLFKKLEKTIISKVKIRNGDYISVKCKGIVAINSLSSLKYISDVLYIPNID